MRPMDESQFSTLARILLVCWGLVVAVALAAGVIFAVGL